MQAANPGTDGDSAPRLKLLGLTVAATLVSINIWTGAPLFALWVGSRIAPASGTSMGAIAVVMLMLVLCVSGLAMLLTRINLAYDRLSGRDTGPRRPAPWLRSARAERNQLARKRVQLSPIERMVTFSVVAAVIVFETWFFFFAHYSIPGA